MVAFKKAKVPPLTVLQFRKSPVTGNEGEIWEAIIGLKVGMVIQPAIRVNERGNGGCLDLDQVAHGDESRALFKSAMAELLHWAERDVQRAEQDSPAGTWTDQLIADMLVNYGNGLEFQFHPPRFVAEPIPLKQKKCWCGKVLDRKEQPYGGTCSKAHDDEEQFNIHLSIAVERDPNFKVADFHWVPLENHVPSVDDLIHKIELAMRRKAWPQEEHIQSTLVMALTHLRLAAVSLKDAKQTLRNLEAARKEGAKP